MNGATETMALFEPYKIHAVDPIKWTSEEEREKALKAAGNLPAKKNKLVKINGCYFKLGEWTR